MNANTLLESEIRLPSGCHSVEGQVVDWRSQHTVLLAVNWVLQQTDPHATQQSCGNWVSGTEPGHSRPIACLICALLRGTFHLQRMAAHPAVEMDMSNGVQLVSPWFVHMLQGCPVTDKSRAELVLSFPWLWHTSNGSSKSRIDQQFKLMNAIIIYDQPHISWESISFFLIVTLWPMIRHKQSIFNPLWTLSIAIIDGPTLMAHLL